MNFDALWQRITAVSTQNNLDTTKFGDTHRQVVADIAAFLAAPTANAVSPIIICGVPGTGKTTFLYVIDLVLRNQGRLPDNLAATMRKPSGETHTLHKRMFGNEAISLLSVRKWADLLHFYMWDKQAHQFNHAARDAFISQTLRPMRVLFTDEVEMTGYAPTIPTLAKNGILVIGTSNQSAFRQLENTQNPPRVYQVGGSDMRSGDPTDAVVTREDGAWELFELALGEERGDIGRLFFHTIQQAETTYIHLDFNKAVNAAMLENEWINFIQSTYQQQTGNPLTQTSKLTLLFDNFSLDTLRTDYNAIMRFVSLFDAIEQLGLGVFVRNKSATPELSREAIDHMKVTMQVARGVSDEIKQKALVGVDRCTSRLGQAGSKALIISR